jgi:hypothetical protein
MKIKHNPKFNTQDRFLDLENLIIDLLPSGSGIDSNWILQQDIKGNVYAYNSYTCYNEAGYTDGYADFYIKIVLVNVELHITQLHFSGSKAQYLAKKYYLKSYLEDMFFDQSHMQSIAIMNNTPVNIATYYG